MGVRLLSYTVNTPELREYAETVAGRPGEYDYGAEWGTREITVKIDVIPNGESLKRRQSKILSWLSPVDSGAGPLIFDEVPDTQYNAKLTGRFGIEQLIVGYGVLTITFKCHDPFGYSTYSVESITVDSAVLVDTEISVDASYTFAVNGLATLNVDNFGAEPVRPVLEISGSFTTLTVTLGGKTLTFGQQTSGTLAIDFSRYLSLRNGVPVPASGDYGQLPAGTSPVVIGGTGINCTVTFRFRTKSL